ncbi:MAG: non-ribosomal peptide synthase/polyketide synthase, partial [Chitinophagaceae bacterium]
MSAQEIIKELRKHNVVPRLEGGQLKLVGETSALVEEVIDRVRSSKGELIAFLKSSTDEFSSAPIPAIGNAEYYPASNAQKRIWIMSQFEGGAPAYNIVTGFYLKGIVDEINLNRAFHSVILRHESLRTVFGEIDGELKQIVREHIPFAITIEDISGIAGDKKKAIKEEIEIAANYPFNLQDGPLLNVKLVRLGKQEYALVLTIHHIISDGWSVTLLLREVMNFYNAYCRQEKFTLDLLPIQYKEYTDWMNRKLEMPRANALQEFWKTQLLANTEPLNLGADFVRPVARSFEGAVIKFLLDHELFNRISEFCRNNQCTPFVFFQSTVAILLSKISGQDTITVGSAVSGRNHYELEDQIGLYMNTLPLQNRINSEDAFVEFLRSVSENTFRAIEFQEYPFDKIVDTLAIKSDAGRNPLFDVMVMVQNSMTADDRLNLHRWHGFEMQQIDEYIFGSPQGEFENMRAKLDLSFNFVAASNKTWLAEIEYSTKLFKKETITRFWNIYVAILSQVLNDPAKKIADIEMVSQDEKRRLLDDFNASSGNYHTDHTIIDLWEQRVKASPDKIALQYADRQFTYEELNELSNQLASYLWKQYQLGPDDLAAIQLQRSEWMVITIFAVLKAGGAYVPIDPAYPQERTDYIIADSGCKLVIDEKELSSFLDHQYLYQKGNLPVINKPGDLAYVMYTSGSTGKPKGVMIEHRNVTSFLDNMEKRFFLREDQVFGATTSFTFDISVLELIASLLHGMKLFLIDSNDPAFILKQITDHQLNVLQVTPSRLTQLLEQEEALQSLSGLEVFLVGGESLAQDKYDQLKQLNATKVVHVYGPTETTIWSTSCELHETALLSIGKPLENESIFIRDRHHALSPAGIIGEICIGGAGVARGYLNRPELSAEKFVSNPFRNGERMYRTGDLGRWLEDGSIEFIGRLDDQVKIRGHRIELGEIESIIRQYEGITSAVVTAKGEAERELIAYVVNKGLLNKTALRSYLQEKLPVYMVPAYIIEMEAFPLMINGKIDRKRLPQPSAADMKTGTAYVAPRTSTEEKLVAIWSDVLGAEKERISVKDNFFELGGNSLKATRLAGQLYRTLDIKIDLQELFLRPVLEQQAQLIEQTKRGKFHSIHAAPAAMSYPVSASQRRLWILSQFEAANAAYNLPGAYVFEGELDREALSHSFSRLISRHESLRTIFSEDANDEVRQFIVDAEEIDFSIAYRDVREEENPDKLIKELVEQDFVRAFDLGKGPLLRAALYQLDEKRLVLSYAMHHIISDGWSMGVLIRELMLYYRSFKNNGQQTLNGLRIQYKDYAVWQQEQLSNASLQADRSYWLQQFSGPLPVTDLPSDKPRPAVKTYNGSVVYKQIDTQVYRAIKGIGAQQNATLFMSILSVVNALLYRYTGHEDIIIGSPVAGREHPDLEDQIGFYANTLALRSQFSGDDTFHELLDRVKKMTLGAYAHQLYPFDQLVSELQLVRDRSRHPLFDIQVIVQNEEFHLTKLIEGGFTELGIREYREASLQSSVFDMVFNFLETGSGLDLSVTYNRNVYSRRMVEQLAAHLEQMMNAIIESPSVAVRSLKYLASAELKQLTEKLNDTKEDYDEAATLVSLFEEQVERTPDAEAVFYHNQSMTYREVHEQSNKLANHLKANYSINVDDKIGIMLDRSAQMMIAMLGVLKAGAAYVPVDTKYPSARKKFILEDTGMKILLTQTDYIFDLDYYTGDVFAMDVQLDMIDNNPATPDVFIDPNSLAYVIYTSGSTGQPKGVMIEHRSIANTVQSQQFIFDVHPGFHHLQFASASFDASVSEIFVALCSGGSLYIVNEEEKKDPALLKNFIDSNNIDIATIPPAYLQLLNVEDLRTLKRLVTAGEAAVKDKVAGFSAFGDYYNAYGPTETSICTSVYKNPKGNTIEHARVPVGRPIANTSVYILSENGELCAKGVAGEICVSGRGIARGYLNRGELTAEKFADDPFRPGYRMYKTGDVGRWLENGELEFLGRKDEQVKLRGYRIEPGEIENVLQKHEAVLQAVALVRENATGEKELVVYVVGNEKGLDIAELRAFAARELPAYMLPHHYVELAELPLNSSGKIDKSRLPAVEDHAVTSGSEYIEARTEIEAAVISVYEEVLKKKPIGVKEDFFVLGGDSIKSIQVVSRLKQKGYSLSIQDVLMYPVVEELCKMVRTGTRSIQQAPEKGEIGLSPVQRYFFESSHISPHHYNQSVLLKSRVHLSKEGLRESLGKLVIHHDALRIIFPLNDNGNRRQLNLGTEQGYSWEALEGLNSEQISEHCQKIQSSIDLKNGPLFKACLFKGKDEEADHLLLVSHHLVIDGVSWRILFDGLSQLYGQYERNEPLELPLKTDSFRSWQRRQEQYATSNELQKEVSYWDEVEKEALSVPQIAPAKQGSNLYADRQTVSFTLSEEKTDQLLTECYLPYRTGINDILLTGLGSSLNKVLDISDVVLSMEGHGREDIGGDLEVTQTVGWFTTTYPVVLHPGSAETMSDLLVAVKESLHRVPKKGIGYGILRYLSGNAYTCNPAVSFNYLGDFGSGIENREGGILFDFSIIHRGIEVVPQRERDVLLDVSGIIIDGGLQISIGYSAKQFEHQQMESLASGYRDELEGLVAWLSPQTQECLTPSDLTYNKLTVAELKELNSDGDIENAYRLSPLQEGLYYHWLSSPGSSSYFIQTTCRIQGALSEPLLLQSYNRLISRHGVLRSYFTQEYGELLQVVKKEQRSSFTYKNISLVSAENVEQEVVQYKQQDRDQGFDLHHGSQMRLTVLQLDEELYEFIWSHHHILMDGWCAGVLIKEFFTIYESLLHDGEAALAPVVKYEKYIEWLQHIDQQASVEYWHEYLDGFEFSERIWEPNRTRHGLKDQRMMKRLFEFPASLMGKLRSACAQLGVTENTFIQAAWGVLMGRYTNSEDVLFGSVVSGRPAALEGVEEMIGLFSNTVPVRVRWEEASSVSDIVKQMQEAWIKGSGHHYVQLAEIQAGRELFNQVMVMENYPMQEMLRQSTMGYEGISFLSSAVVEHTNYDLTITLIPGDALTIKFDCNGNLYSEEQIEKLQQHFTRLAEQMVSNPSVRIKELKLLSEEERNEVTNLFNDTAASYDESATIVSLFEQQAAQTPDAAAVVFEGRSMTYTELNELSNQLGDYLHKKYSIKREDLIGICLDRNEWMVVSILGILKAGAGYVPIDVRYPQERIDYMISDSGCKAVIDEKELSLFLESKDEYSKENLSLVNQPTDVAYVIYTSGTTGNPKGVMIEHRNVVRLLKTDKPLFDFSSSDVWTMFHSYCFDFSVWEMYGALLFGGKLVVIPLTVAQDPAAYLQVLRTEGVTVLNQTPSSFYQVITQELQQPTKDLALRYVIFGGEALSPSRLWEWKNRYPDTKLINMYGITETTVHVTYKEITNEEIATDSSSIGKAIPTLSCYVLDKHQELVPVGVVGELYVGGAGVGRGYLNREELTAQRFIESPFKKGERLYRSGDRARVLQNGELEYGGRLDEQVKIRGYRIELGEIESVIRQYEGIESVAVIASAKEEGDRELIAYVVSKDISKQSLRTHLQEKLPSYMVPGYIIEMEVLPLTSNGKLDRKRLPQPSGDDIESEKEYIAPRTATEEKLAEIWSEVLGIEKEKIGVKDNFFELGGHSLKATRLAGLLYRAFDVKVELRELFMRAVMEDQAQLISESLKTTGYTISPVKEQTEYLLSSSQQRLWLLSQFGDANAAYNVPAAYILEGELNRPALEHAFASLIQRHESLRTVFRENDHGDTRQYVLLFQEINFSIEEKDLRGSDADIKDVLQESFSERFELATGPLLRVKLFRTEESKWVLSFVMHHIISDAWSAEIMLDELLLFYNRFEHGYIGALPPLRIQYKDYAAWEQEQLNDGLLKTQKEYWGEQFEGELPVIDLPVANARPVVQTFNGKVFRKTLDSNITRGLKLIAREQGATLFMSLLAGINTLLYKYSGQHDIILGSPIAGREHPDLHEQVGFYTNTLALRTRFETEDNFKSLLKNIKGVMLGAYENQLYPFDQLVEDLDVKRDMSRNALFDISVVLQNDTRHSGKKNMNGSLSLTPYGQLESSVSKFDLTFDFTETADELQLDLEYNTDIYDRAVIERLCSHLEILFTSIINQPALAIESLEYLTAREKYQLLHEFNNGGDAYPKEKNIVGLFEEQAQNHAAGTAITYKNNSLSYEELNERSNQLAHYLKNNFSIGAGDLVGIKLDRSEWMIVALLGVLKAGGAYLPIDPAYPAERIEYMISDSGCKLLLDELQVKEFEAVREEYQDSNPENLIQPDSLAYVIYTSGSTGLPKGCCIAHKSLSNYIQWSNSHYFVQQKANFGLFTSLSFDLTVTSIFCSLTTGGSLSVYGQQEEIADILLHSFNDNDAVNSIKLTPSHISLLKHMDIISSGIQCAIVGGEEVTTEHVRILKDINPAMRIYNEYGPTEATVGCIVKELQQNEPVLIGKPIAGAEIYILGKGNQLCATGIPGEICISGIGLATGYLNKPALTAEKFIANPFISGERMYKTGDAAAWLADGNVLYVGRKDDQVKLRGYRIELNEIENSIRSYDDVDNAVVVLRQDGEDEKNLVAYLTSGITIDISALRRHLNTTLPAYMLPAYFVQLDSLPLTHNGKIDKRNLPDPKALQSAIPIARTAPRNLIEEKLVEIWSEVLSIDKDQISVTDNFFDLGGHSLKANRLVLKIHKEFDIKIELRDLFSKVVLEDQAALIAETKTTSFVKIPVAPVQWDYPLSSSQRRLWVLSRFSDATVAYHIPGVYILQGEVNRDALEYCFNVLIERHEILRTVFKEDALGEVRQYVLGSSEVKFSMGHADLRGQVDVDEKIRKLVHNQSMLPFDLSSAPLVRAGLYQAAENRWVLSYVMHHIISDGWSMGILITELMMLYNAYVQQQESPLPELRIQYKDYAVWQQQQLDKGLAEHEAYWLQQFEGEIPVLELVTDKVRPAVKTYNGGMVKRRINTTTTQGIKELSNEQSATLFMSLLASVNVLLYKYTGQQDIIIGSPTAGREHADLDDQIGFYVNTLALRTQFSEENSYRELLDNIRQVTLGAYKHQVYPFDELIDKLDLPRDMGRHPLFDVVMVLQNAAEKKLEWRNNLDKIHIGDFESERVISKFDLTFIFEEVDDRLQLDIEYNSDLFNASGIERMADHLQQLLETITQQPSVPAKNLSCLSPDEEQLILGSFNDTKTNFPADRTIVQLFEELVEKHGDRTAVIFEDSILTYGELNQLTNQLAGYLRKNYQLAPDDLVGLLLPRSEWMIVATLAILKAGSAYVPIDPEYPQERIDYMIADSGCKLVIDEKELAAFSEQQHLYREENPIGYNKPTDLAYVLYTSGSTGQPKGVMGEHRNVVRLVKNTNYISISENDCLLTLSSYVFDGFTFDMYGALLNGAALAIRSKALILDLDELAPFIAKNNVTVFFLTTALFNTFSDSSIVDFSNVHTILFGGEAGSVHHVRQFMNKYPSISLLNVYGPTENTTFSSVWKVEKLSANDKGVCIGPPIANSEVYVTDRSSISQLAPVGVPGEICVSGAGVARGYLNRPELTAERFVANPFRNGERMYRTGDLGRWLENGTLEFITRLDGQVKIRGYRIETGEIESVISGYEGITGVAVIATEPTKGMRELAAYVVSKEILNKSALRSYLQEKLPGYMMPAYVIQLEVLPLTINGKIDKRRLPHPSDDDIKTGDEYTAPRTATENELAALWSSILGLEKERISINDNFFELGGHSLKVTRLSGQLFRTFNVKLELRELFAHPVLEQQAQLIEKAKRSQFYSIQTAPASISYPLSASQRRLWILSQFEAANAAYNIPAAYVFEGELDREALSYSFSMLLSKHESLRTVFRQTKEEVRQYVLKVDEHEFAVAYSDIRDIENKEQKAREFVEQDFVRPFDLGRGPLLRAGLYQVDDNRWVLSYVMHHIISDGWSMGVLIRELLSYYKSYVNAGTHEVNDLRIQYKDYAVWQQEQLSGEELESHRSYWLEQFSGSLPVIDLPSDKPRPAVKTYNGSVIYKQIGAQPYKAIKDLGLQQGATTFMTLVGVVNVLLHRYTGHEDIIIGSPVAGREHPDLEAQIGFYANTLALRTQFSGNDSFYQLLDRVKETTLGATAHQLYPFDELVGDLQLVRDRSRHPLFDIQVIVQNDEDQPQNLAGGGNLSIKEYLDAPVRASIFDMVFNFTDLKDRFELSITYNTDVYSQSIALQLAEHVASLLETITRKPGEPINELVFLNELERTELIELFNDTKKDYDAQATLVSLFTEQVQHNPEAVGVIGNRSMTYKQLDEQSSQLAAHLQRQYAVQAGEMIAVMMDRNEGLLIALLAILKSGGVYVPVDAAYPRSRKEFILKDSNCHVLLTESQYMFDLDYYSGEMFAMDIQLDGLEAIESAVYNIDSSSLAYVIYTSGSTGEPKGVMVEHKAIVNTVYSQRELFEASENEHHLQFASSSFDASISEIFVCLSAGGTLCMMDEAQKKNPEELQNYINTHNIALATLPPSYVSLLDKSTLGIKRLVTAGEAAIPKDVRESLQYGTYINAYGPTETSICATLWKRKQGETFAGTRVPIGRPIANTNIYIISDNGQLCAKGVTGEICVSGRGVARGYLNREELTAAKFVDDPFREGNRMYKTGDLGRWMENGELEFLGRKDEQVKLRGYRIEPGEIEGVLQKMEDVLQAVVLVRENELVAYIVSRGNGLNITALRDHAANWLPAYMLPHHYVELAELPLNRSGKVDKNKLPAVEGHAIAASTEYIGARTE